jgi:transposase-like protein
MDSCLPPLFRKRQFEPAIIVTCVRWYLRFSLSLRDLEELMAERGVSVDHTALLELGQRQWWAMTHRQRIRNPLFAKRWFADDTIIRCVHWYLRFKLSYRDLAHIMGELGVCVAPCKILRWVVRYSVAFAECWRHCERAVGRSWRCDETYIKVGGRWMYLYRTVDERGNTVESHLSRTRDIAAAKAFFREALKRHGQARTVTLDGFEATHSALRRMGMRNEFNARRVIIGIEFVHKVHKDQFHLGSV